MTIVTSQMLCLRAIGILSQTARFQSWKMGLMTLVHSLEDSTVVHTELERKTNESQASVSRLRVLGLDFRAQGLRFSKLWGPFPRVQGSLR